MMMMIQFRPEVLESSSIKGNLASFLAVLGRSTSQKVETKGPSVRLFDSSYCTSDKRSRSKSFLRCVGSNAPPVSTIPKTCLERDIFADP